MTVGIFCLDGMTETSLSSSTANTSGSATGAAASALGGIAWNSFPHLQRTFFPASCGFHGYPAPQFGHVIRPAPAMIDLPAFVTVLEVRARLDAPQDIT